MTQSPFGGGGTWPTLLEGDGQPRFLAVILSTGALFDEVLSQAPRAELEALECQFGIRRLTAHVVPGCRPRPAHGTHAGRLDHVNAALIPSGRTVSAAGYQSIPGSWGYLATAVSQEHFETLVAATDGSALVGIHRRRDGREEMVRRSTPTLTKRRLTCCAGASWSG